jgi:subtilase family serine protease
VKRRFAFPLLAVAGASVTATVIVAAGQHTADPSPAEHAAAASPTQPRDLGATPPGETIRFGVVLRLREHAVERYLQGLEQPGSPNYRHFLSPAAFGRRFGVPRAGVDEVQARLVKAGLRVVASYRERTLLLVTGTVANASAFLGVRFRDYRDREGRRYHAPLGTVRVARALVREVAGYSGLDTRRLLRPADVPLNPCGKLKRSGSPRDRCSALSPQGLATAYDITPLYRAGVRGQGETIAILSLSRFRQRDVKLFGRGMRVGRGKPTVNNAESEADLDVETAHSIAPKAQVLNYEINDERNTNALAQVFHRIVTDGRANIVSVSYGWCEDRSLFKGYHENRLADQNEMRVAEARGISIYVATGDGGAYDCQRYNYADHRVIGDWPADSPHAVAVGGTALSVRRDGSYLEEAGWEDILSNAGTEGGVSPSDPRPKWQAAPGVDNEFSTAKRQIPDIAASASGQSPYLIVNDGQLTPIWGTSGSTPFMAAMMALVDQYSRKHGAGRIGFSPPLLYRLARERQPFPPYHDVVRGGDRYHNAGPGWDYATGLGSPDVWNLARDVVAASG